MNLDRLRRAWKRRVWMSVLSRIRPEVEVGLSGRRMGVELRDEVIGRLLYLSGEYEPYIERLVRYMDLRGGVCIDIGANIGLHTLTLSELVGPAGRVFAFEPEAHNFD